MIFNALVRKIYRETKNKNFFARIACFIASFYFQKKSNHQKALFILNKLKDLKQDIAYFYLAYFSYTQRDFTQGLKYLNIFLRNNPNHADAIYLKCHILCENNQKDEAFSLLENLLKNSSRVKTWIELANLVENTQDFKKMQNLYEQNIDNYPKFKAHLDELLKAFAKAATNVKEYTLAKKFLKEAVFIFLKKGSKAHFIPKKAMRLDDAKEALNDLAKVFKENHMQMFLVSGTFLGCIREKKFLSHDYDIDVGVYTELEKLKELFVQNKNFTLKNLSYEGGVQVYHINGIYIDVFLHYEENGAIYHNGDFMRWKNTPFELVEYDFLGSKYLGAKDYDLYLKENYGEDWRTPKNSFEFNSFLDTPNIEILDKDRMIIFLYELLFKTFAINNEEQILNALKAYKEEAFVQEYLNFKKENL